MPQVTAISMNSSSYTKNNTKNNNKVLTNSMSVGTKIILGTSLTAMAVGGIYIASKGRGVSVDKAFKQIKNASSYMDTLKNIRM